jgi:hypothetical protein
MLRRDIVNPKFAAVFEYERGAIRTPYWFGRIEMGSGQKEIVNRNRPFSSLQRATKSCRRNKDADNALHVNLIVARVFPPRKGSIAISGSRKRQDVGVIT